MHFPNEYGQIQVWNKSREHDELPVEKSRGNSFVLPPPSWNDAISLKNQWERKKKPMQYNQDKSVF